ncbi:uncharacterized protein N7511_003417 [Penicillium nucicola]|uniref:uncharacterized protein n=1 Tax=Penicillium nucicola TaxID=1850975 RepID=UPI002544E7C3|nr:uncharacterized protein N7511_003417 [Penicillium nucicola]KAJ5771366.1 hypothetical protein N7511_003417 [Penicillium nucicola]
MAELVGTIASVITFAALIAQLGKSIATLKECWHDVQYAPEELCTLVRDIEIFGSILDDIEADLQQESLVAALGNSKHAAQSYRACKEAAKDMDVVCQELLEDLRPPGHRTGRNGKMNRLRRSYGAVKVGILKKGKVERLVGRLQNAMRLLLLSQQCYTRALIQVQPELIAQRIAQDTKPTVTQIEWSEVKYTPVSYNRKESNRLEPLVSTSQKETKSQRSRVLWRLSLPSWITAHTFELAGIQARDGWKWDFRTYNEIPEDSKTVQCVETGDLKELQELFASRKASPFDRVSTTGYTLLFYAHSANRAEIIKFLLQEGTDPGLQGQGKVDFNTALRHLVWTGNMFSPDSRHLLPSMRLLCPSEEMMYETPEEVLGGILSDFHGSAEEFLFFQRQFCPTFYDMPQWVRVAVAARATSGIWDASHMPGLVRTVLGDRPWKPENLQLQTSWRWWKEMTLVHCIAMRIGGSLAALEKLQRQRGGCISKDGKSDRMEFEKQFLEALSLYEAWNALFHDLLLAGVDLHHVVGGMTPFLAFLGGFVYWWDFNNCVMKGWNLAISAWVTDLQEGGVDLQRFGQMEEQVWENGLIERDVFWRRNWGWQRVVGFSHGPYPRDWKLWLSERSDGYSGEFWEMIDEPVPVIPGAWPNT